MGKPKTTREAGPSDDVGINWLECDMCSSWDIYENTGLLGPYSAVLAKKASYVCRYCKLSGRVEEMFHQIDKIAAQLGTAPGDRSWSDTVKTFPIELQATKDEMNKLLDDNCKSLKDELSSIKVNISSSSSSNPTGTLSAPQLRQATSQLLDVES